MNKRKSDKNSVARSLASMTVGRLILSEAIFTLALIVLLFGGEWICSLFTWTGDELFYRLLSPIHRNMYLSFLILWAIGAIIVVISHEVHMARYFQDMTDAADLLLSDDDQTITLPTPLRQAELQLNRLKAESVRNAAAARDAEQRKNDLVVYLAHDLKTPLTSVIGYLSLLHDEADIPPELQERYIGIALDKSQRLEELINEFFEITRFNLTHLTLEPETVDLTRMLEQITFEFNPLLEEKGLSWNISLPPEMKIVCDPDKLERVFDNLIRNAVNYSYRDSVLSLSAEKVDNCVLLRFRNSGKTIPPEKLSRIFEQFYRMDSSRSSSTGGSGLGLAIAKEIVSLHGGGISAESKDETVTFTVLLPNNCKKNV